MITSNTLTGIRNFVAEQGFDIKVRTVLEQRYDDSDHHNIAVTVRKLGTTGFASKSFLREATLDDLEGLVDQALDDWEQTRAELREALAE